MWTTAGRSVLRRCLASNGTSSRKCQKRRRGLDAKAEDNYFTAKEIAEAASLPIHLFRDQAERNRKRVPHLMLVGNLRFSLPAILEWEMANSGVGSAAAIAPRITALPQPCPSHFRIPNIRGLVRPASRDRGITTTHSADMVLSPIGFDWVPMRATPSAGVGPASCLALSKAPSSSPSSRSMRSTWPSPQSARSGPRPLRHGFSWFIAFKRIIATSNPCASVRLVPLRLWCPESQATTIWVCTPVKPSTVRNAPMPHF
jgi:hypothetical protein